MKPTLLFFRFVLGLLLSFILNHEHALAINRISVASGDWNASATWSPSGSPSPSDNITIAPGHLITVSTNQTIHDVSINAGGTLTWITPNVLSITGTFTVNGTVAMNGGNISLTNSGLPFVLGSNALFIWDPGTNTVAGATLFTNGVESFAPTSTLIIKKWYSYTTPLTAVVTGNFGNLEINTFNGTTISEWNQNNGFETHQITGTLSIDQGWVTLDKSGAISNTTIGNIVLKGLNSTFYGHYGTHPSTFTLTTSSVTNNGGTFYGLNDGNGNINLHVTGNFTNSGNVKIINNSGISNVSNGNVFFTVDSSYIQSSGDTRIIYNVSTTNSGLMTSSFRNVTLNGGIFMGQSGCRTSGGLCTMSIMQNLSISFQNATDKFRVASISSIGNSMNTVQVSLFVGGNVSISGVLNAEVTSSAAAGTETVTINGTTVINGCNVSFNYGAPTSSHSNTLVMNNNLTISGGIVFLSRNNGTTTLSVNGNMSLSAGQLTMKGGDNAATLQITGTFTQTGGQFYIHNNSSTPSTSPCTVTIMDNFSQTSGLFSFDSNPSNTTAEHTLNLCGSSFTAGGNGSITRAGVGTSNAFGILNFKRTGLVTYARTSTFNVLSQVKQLISKPCTLKVTSGTFITSSYPSFINDMVKVSNGACLNLMTSQIASNGTYPYSSLTVDSNATITIQRTQGFYDGTPLAAVSSNMSYNLHSHSIVEYNGTSTQVLTGNVAGIPPVNNQYGILKINMTGNAAKALMTLPAIVRTKIILTNGELNLGGNTLTLNNGSAVAMTRVAGYINAELAGLMPGTVIWKNMYKGMHEFPFGTSPSVYLPVRFFFMVGNVTDVTASTYATPSLDNVPLPVVNGAAVNFLSVSNTYSSTNLIDRWWNINAPGVIAGLTVSYKGAENTMSTGYQTGQIGIVSWTGNGWSAPACVGSGVTAGIGTVSAEIMSDFSAMSVGKQTGLKMISNIRTFTAEQVGDEVALNWSTEVEYNSDYFSVERSSDGEYFEEISKEKASGTSMSPLKYSKADADVTNGKVYYRVKMVSASGTISYSSVREVNVVKGRTSALSIESFGPNPFESGFDVNYKLGKDDTVRFELSGSTGQIILQSEIAETEGSHAFNFKEGENLQPGIYFLKIVSGGKSITKKLVKK